VGRLAGVPAARRRTSVAAAAAARGKGRTAAPPLQEVRARWRGPHTPPPHAGERQPLVGEVLPGTGLSLTAVLCAIDRPPRCPRPPPRQLDLARLYRDADYQPQRLIGPVEVVVPAGQRPSPAGSTPPTPPARARSCTRAAAPQQPGVQPPFPLRAVPPRPSSSGPSPMRVAPLCPAPAARPGKTRRVVAKRDVPTGALLFVSEPLGGVLRAEPGRTLLPHDLAAHLQAQGLGEADRRAGATPPLLASHPHAPPPGPQGAPGKARGGGRSRGLKRRLAALRGCRLLPNGPRAPLSVLQLAPLAQQPFPPPPAGATNPLSAGSS
jgi:hypothetical protein